MRIPRWVLLTFFFAIQSATAQHSPMGTTDTTHAWQVGLSVGVGRIANLDGVGSPLVYSGFQMPLGLDVEFATTNARHRISGNAVFSGYTAQPLFTPLSTTDMPRKAYYGYWFAQYEYLHSTAGGEPPPDPDRIQFGLGGAWRTELFYRNYSYQGYPKGALGGAYSFEGTTSLELEGCVWKQMTNMGTLGATLAIPIVGLLRRPPYGYYALGDGTLFGTSGETTLVYFGKMFGWQLSVDWRYDILEHMTLGARFTNEEYRYQRDIWTTNTSVNSLEGLVAWRF